MRRHFERQHERRELRFRADPFKYSFRSAPIVLDAVDTVFSQPSRLRRPDRRSGADRARGGARRGARPGRNLAAGRAGRAEHESSPGMRRSTSSSETSPRVKLARRSHRRETGSGAAIWSATATAPAVRPGDMLILVRQRGALFEAIIRALKNAGIRGRRRRPAGAHRAYRRDGPDGAGRRAAAAAGRSGARDGAEEPAVRARRGRAVRARLGPQGQRCARRCATQRPDLAARLDALERRTARAAHAVRLLRRPARRRRRPQAVPGAARRRGQRRARRIPQSRARLRERARRRRCRASSPGCAPPRPRSSATWRWRATRCG